MIEENRTKVFSLATAELRSMYGARIDTLNKAAADAESLLDTQGKSGEQEWLRRRIGEVREEADALAFLRNAIHPLDVHWFNGDELLQIRQSLRPYDSTVKAEFEAYKQRCECGPKEYAGEIMPGRLRNRLGL